MTNTTKPHRALTKGSLREAADSLSRELDMIASDYDCRGDENDPIAAISDLYQRVHTMQIAMAELAEIVRRLDLRQHQMRKAVRRLAMEGL